jgi:site-specific DNA recombinase
MALVLASLYGDRANKDSRAKSAHVKRGIAKRIEDGHYLGSIAPFGYQFVRDKNDASDPGKLIPDERTAPTLRRIFAEYLAGAGDKTIAFNLNADGIPSGRGRTWCGSAVKQIVTNPTYVGKLARRAPGGRYVAEVLDGRHEPLIDEGTFARAQDLRAARKSKAGNGRGRPVVGSHLCVNGLLRCGECGSAMVARTGRNGRSDAYICRGRDESRGGGPRCSMGQVTRERVDATALAYFETHLIDDEATVARLMAEHGNRVAEIEALLVDAEAEHAAAQAALDRLDRDYLAGRLAAESHERLLRKATAEAEACAANAERLRAQREAIDDEPAQAGKAALAQVAKLREAVASRVASADGVDSLRAVLTETFARIELHRIEFDHDGERVVQLYLVPKLRAEAVAKVLPVTHEIHFDPDGDNAAFVTSTVPKRVALSVTKHSAET